MREVRDPSSVVWRAGAWLAGVLLSGAATVASAATEGRCSAADREALLVGALYAEIKETVGRATVPCVIVAVEPVGETRTLKNPNNWVMNRLQRLTRVRVVRKNEETKCPKAPQVFALEPEVCSPSAAYVYTGNVWGERAFRKVGNNWEEVFTGYE